MKFLVCAATGVLTTVIMNTIGAVDNTFITLCICIVIDFIAGLIVSVVFGNSPKTKTGGVNSKICYIGLVKKFAIIAVVVIAQRFDILLDVNYIRTAVCMSFIVNETISIIENLALMGVPVPDIILRSLDLLNEKEDKNEKRN